MHDCRQPQLWCSYMLHPRGKNWCELCMCVLGWCSITQQVQPQSTQHVVAIDVYTRSVTFQKALSSCRSMLRVAYTIARGSPPGGGLSGDLGSNTQMTRPFVMTAHDWAGSCSCCTTRDVQLASRDWASVTCRHSHTTHGLLHQHCYAWSWFSA